MPSVIKAGVKPESRKKLIALWKAAAAKEAAGASREAAALGRRLESAQGKARAALLKALDGNRATRRIRKEVAAIDKAARALGARPARTAVQRRAVEKELLKLRNAADAIEKAHRRSLLDAYEKSAATDAYRNAVIRAARRSGRLEMKERNYGGLWLRWAPPGLDMIDWEALKNLQTSFTFEPPYDDDATVTEEFSALAGGAFAFGDAGTGSVSANAVAVIGGYQMARTQHGAFLTIPSGFDMLRIQVRLVDIKARVIAWAVVGGSWSSTGPIAEVTDLASNNTRRVEGSINYVVAPLLWYSQDIFEGPLVFNAEIEIPEEGGEILVTAGMKCDVWAALPAASVADSEGVVEKITVELA
ncbi:MAG: hypothetical protein EYC70_05305 [Planctomycetota bacterium]|nr:MAG: hypothetical protein EYC70_05305 [Planctomycetota bacterium]